MGRAVAPFRSVESRVDSVAEIVEYSPHDERGDDHRVKPGNPSQAVIIETSFPGLGDPGDDKPREDKEHQDRSSTVIRHRPKDPPADTAYRVVRQKDRKRRGKPQPVEVERQGARHRNRYEQPRGGVPGADRPRPAGCRAEARPVSRAPAAVRPNPRPVRFRLKPRTHSSVDHGPFPAEPGAATPLHRSGRICVSGRDHRSERSHLSAGYLLRAAAACGSKPSKACRPRGSRWSSLCRAPTSRYACRRTPSCCPAGSPGRTHWAARSRPGTHSRGRRYRCASAKSSEPLPSSLHEFRPIIAPPPTLWTEIAARGRPASLADEQRVQLMNPSFHPSRPRQRGCSRRAGCSQRPSALRSNG